MLFTQENSLEEIFQSIKHELNRGALDPKHPFRFVTLATKSENGIDARYLVLRSVDEALNFYLFTDARTSKVQQLTVFPDAVLLFYHPGKRIQVKVRGNAEVRINDGLTASFWSKVQGDARKAYNQKMAPGTTIKAPKEAFDWQEPLTESNFAIIKIKPEKIEALQLNRMEHLRIVMNSKEGNWDISWIAP
ncbi:pyridoxamine 5'-phosphate oxidase family protein [Aquiflexum gelatinilyticum]|uniref:pyridoxamine 5'-phosphate oxidase family protein n=1 Tax=Aquiflexum gelatinilyticum TaxID=2961943 RepID=UPI002167C2EF|nr:pyridoxamine 5'-phosphate oxidase family protein [Aquiflexum gelatinilyticum]MCS4433898.1 pyridoxamine 5'-phosphate oxidase family protein [Aquiflexum gelatinilyticum]